MCCNFRGFKRKWLFWVIKNFHTLGDMFCDFLVKMMDCGTRIDSTLKRVPWDSITYNQILKNNDKQICMPSNGIPMLLLKHATLSSTRVSGNVIRLTVGAYRNGMGIVCMLMSTEYHTNY